MLGKEGVWIWGGLWPTTMHCSQRRVRRASTLERREAEMGSRYHEGMDQTIKHIK